MSWLREKMKVFIWITVVAFVVTIFAAWGMNYMGVGAARQQQYVAVVNGESVPYEQYAELLNRHQERFRDQHQRPLTAEDRERLKREAFEQLVDNVLLQQAFRESGGVVTPDEVRTFFAASNRMVTSEGRIDEQRLNQVLRRMSDPERERVESQIRDRVEQFQMRQWLESQVGITRGERRTLLQNGLRQAHTFGIYVDPSTFVPREKVEQYYRTHDRRFRLPPRARIRQIQLTLGDTGTPREERLKELTNRVSVIKRRFNAGDSFARLARQYSADTRTASRGGLRAWITRESASEAIARAAFNLEPGEMSNLVKAPQGYFLIYLEEGPLQPKQPLEDVEGTIRQRLLADTHWEQARSRAETYHDRVRAAKDPLNKLQELAFLHSHGEASSQGGEYGWVPARFIVPELHEQPGLWRGVLTDGSLIDPAISSAIFAGAPGRLREPVRSPFGWHVFYVEEYRQPHLDTLSDTSQRRIQRYVTREKQVQFLRSWLAHKRSRARVTLKVSRSRIGGEIPWLEES